MKVAKTLRRCCNAQAPEAAASGSVNLSRDSNSFTCRAPAVDVSASLLLKPAPIDAVKTVLTQVNLASWSDIKCCLTL